MRSGDENYIHIILPFILRCYSSNMAMLLGFVRRLLRVYD